MAVRLAHANLRVKDPAASVRFYRALGLYVQGALVISDQYYLLYLAADRDDQTTLELTINETGGPDYDRSPGSGHFAIAVGDLDARVTLLRQNGIDPDQEPFHPGDRPDLRVCFVTDPDGHKIEVIEGTFPTPRDALPPAVAALLAKQSD